MSDTRTPTPTGLTVGLPRNKPIESDAAANRRTPGAVPVHTSPKAEVCFAPVLPGGAVLCHPHCSAARARRGMTRRFSPSPLSCPACRIGAAPIRRPRTAPRIHERLGSTPGSTGRGDRQPVALLDTGDGDPRTRRRDPASRARRHQCPRPRAGDVLVCLVCGRVAPLRPGATDHRMARPRRPRPRGRGGRPGDPRRAARDRSGAVAARTPPPTWSSG